MPIGCTPHRRALGALLTAAALAGCAAAAQPGMPVSSAPPSELRRRAAEGGAFLLQTAQLGADRAQRPELRRFAPFEVSEQQGLMRAMMLVDGRTAIPPAPADKAEMIRRLNAAQGPAFDAMFVTLQTQGHQEALAVYTAMQQSGAAAPADQAIAVLAADRIREHLAFLQAVSARG